ncbi:MAG: Crp/Fnr family transcriptional regulator, partial [Ardenticatenaceae bacterium]|nr:Crp/Fnr family transcriptional regulator [Ardenticatenaceae bacterium]
SYNARMQERPSPTQLAQQLATIPLFAALEEAILHDLAAGAHWAFYAEGEAVFWEGEPAQGLYYLQSGWLKVVKSAPSGREQVIKFLGAGELFNEIGALANLQNPATAVALEPSGVWLIRRETVWGLLQTRPSFAQYLIENLAGRVQHLVELVTDLSLRTVKGRLARLILEDTTGNQFHRPQWYTQAELAARLGTVPDVIQRALRSLAADGVIEVERHRIHVHDRAALEKIAEK